MRELSTLKGLAEASGKSSLEQQFLRYMTKLTDLADDMYTATDTLQKYIKSDQLTGFLKDEGFPATESRAAITATIAAFEAVKKAGNEIADLHMAIGTHYDPMDDND